MDPSPRPGDRIVVGLSGGVDSAVAAYLLGREGYEVHALHMRNWDDDDAYCTAAEDLQVANEVCATLDVPLHKVSFAAEYRERVFRRFLDEYAAGRTPNPDVLCNAEIKFDAFLAYAKRLGAVAIATGHYARVRVRDGRAILSMAHDQEKDQTYFLHAVDNAALAQTLFPLGDLQKTEVRRVALEAGLPNFARHDSTGICFIGERPFREFLGGFLPARPGNIHDLDGAVIGEHQGVMYYTIGQRRGLRIGGRVDADDAPWYVVDKDVASNRLIVAQGHDHPALLDRGLIATELHWIDRAPVVGEALLARTRHRQHPQPCEIVAQDSATIQVRFTSPQRAVTPGQYVVLYRDYDCLGGGVIAARGLGAEAA